MRLDTAVQFCLSVAVREEELSTSPDIPDYELLRVIGRGSYGDVWLARGLTGVYRAIKVVWRDRFPDADPYEREFKGLREFAAISLEKPRQMALLHVGGKRAAGWFYYVMELADDAERGRHFTPESYVPLTLKELRKRRSVIPAKECVTMSVEMTTALNDLHSIGLVHRDIKPSNVIFVGGVPKLADIGLVSSASAALTYVGTEGFVPPEGPGTTCADIFSLGKVLYEMATGLDRHEYPRLPADLLTRPDHKALLEFNEVLLRACDPLATNRYADAAALLEDLLLLQAGHSVRRMRATERRLARATRWVILLASIASIAGTGVWIERRRSAREYALRLEAQDQRDQLARRLVYVATLTQARQALDLGDWGRARKLLSDVKPAIDASGRNFEWHVAWQEAQGDSNRLIHEPGAPVRRLSLSPDAKTLAALDAECRVILYDTATLQEAGKITGVTELAGWSSNGRWLIGSDEHGMIRRWSAVGSAESATRLAIGDAIPLGALGPDEVVVFEGGKSPILTIWSFALGGMRARLPLRASDASLTWRYFHGDFDVNSGMSSLVLTSGGLALSPRRIVVVDTKNGRVVFDQLSTARPLAATLVDEKGELFVTYGATRILSRFRINQNPVSIETWPLADDMFGLRCRPDDVGALVMWGNSSNVTMLETAPPMVSRPLRGLDGRVADVAVSARHPQFYVGSYSGEIRVFDLTKSPQPTRKGLWGRDEPESRIVFSPKGDALLVGVDGIDSLVLDSSTLETIERVPRFHLPIAWTERQRIGLAVTDHLIREFPQAGGSSHRENREEIAVEGANTLLCPQLLGDGALLVAALESGELGAWEFSTGKLRRRYRAHGDAPWCIAVTVTGERVWSVGNDHTLVLSDPREGMILQKLELRVRAPRCVCTADGQWLLLGTEDGVIEVRDAETGQLVRELITSSAIIYRLALSPAGDRLVAGGSDGRIYFIDTKTWSILGELKAPRGQELAALAFSPDGRRLGALTLDGELRVWAAW